MQTDEQLQVQIEIHAPVHQVWDLVADPLRMAEWSPQVDGARWIDDVVGVAIGSRFVNDNSHGPLRWTTHGQVIRFNPPNEIAYRIEENWVVWAFSLTDPGSGITVLTQTRETPDGISEYSLRLTDKYMGGQKVFTATMLAGMTATVEAVRAAAEKR